MQKKIIRTKKNIPAQLLTSGLHPVLSQIYANRGIESADELDYRLQNLLSYRMLSDIDQAADLLYEAIQSKKHIFIVGDYDVDGATSLVLAVKLLRAFGAEKIGYFVPDRFKHGYGLSKDVVRIIAEEKPDLIVTVDNGISDIEGVAEANRLGIKVLVTDHHLAGEELPEAAAIVNPNRLDDHFPSKCLAGVGVTFYVMMALRSLLREKDWFNTANIKEPILAEYLDLVALGTISDVVTLDKNNRILVHQGIGRIQSGQCCAGIRAILKLANREFSKLSVSDFAFSIAPRLNAAGRLSSMELSVNCLLEDDFDRATKYARELEKLNDKRKEIELSMQGEAVSFLDRRHHGEKKELPFALCVMNEDWHQGIIGVLASRLKEQFYRPVIVFTKDEHGYLKGSGRSIAKLNLRQILSSIDKKHPEIIKQFGGHAMAAGITIIKDHYAQFAKLFNEYASQLLTKEDLCAEMITDGSLNYEDFSLDVAQLLKTASPWGEGFLEPVFDGRFQIRDQYLVANRHLKLTLEFEGRLIDAIAFNINVDEWPNERCRFIEAVYRLDINHYRGRQKLQLLIENMKPV